jgi:hypothetical protein
MYDGPQPQTELEAMQDQNTNCHYSYPVFRIGVVMYICDRELSRFEPDKISHQCAKTGRMSLAKPKEKARHTSTGYRFYE